MEETECTEETQQLVLTPGSGVRSTARPLAGGIAAAAAALCMAGYLLLGKSFVSNTDSAGTPGIFLCCRQLTAAVVMVGISVCKHGWALPAPEHRRDVHRAP